MTCRRLTGPSSIFTPISGRPGGSPRCPTPPEIDPEERAKRLERFKKLVDIDLLVRESEEGDVALRLLSSTIEGFFGTEGPTDIDEIRRVNDFLADAQAAMPAASRHSPRWTPSPATQAAREAERAIVELGHVGIVIDPRATSSSCPRPRCRPMLEVAAKLKVPVLVHPVGAPNSDALTPRRRHSRPIPSGAGCMNGAAFLSALKAGTVRGPARPAPRLHRDRHRCAGDRGGRGRAVFRRGARAAVPTCPTPIST